MSYLVPLASGSTGNCTLLELGERRVLVDMGISYKQLRLCLARLGLNAGDLDAVLVTHGHSDHIKGLETFMKHETVPVYMTRGTADRAHLDGVCVFGRGRAFSPAPGVEVRSFATSHDCPGSVGFVIRAGGLQIGYATDLGCIPDTILNQLAGSDFQVLEFNHDVDMLREGPYPYPLQQRILSDQGHLCNETAAQAAAWLADRGTRRFLLAHLSQQNNTPAAALAAAQAALAGMEGIVLHVAPVGMGPVIDLNA